MTKNQTESLQAMRVRSVPALLIPLLLLFAGVVVVLAVGLTLNPREVPSPLIGKPVPEFALPAVNGRALGLSKELYCCECNAGYRVNVLHDGLFVVERIRPRPRRSLVSPPGHRRRRTDT